MFGAHKLQWLTNFIDVWRINKSFEFAFIKKINSWNYFFFFSGSLCSFLPHSFCFNAFSSIRMLLSRLSRTEMNNLCMSRLYSICVRKKKESFVWVLIVLRLIIEFFGDFSLQCIFYGTTKRTESFLSFFFHHRFSWFSIQCRQTNTHNGKLHLYMNNCTR